MPNIGQVLLFSLPVITILITFIGAYLLNRLNRRKQQKTTIMINRSTTVFWADLNENKKL